MSIQTVFGNVNFAADEPFREGSFPFEDFFPWRVPDQLIRFTRPKFSGLLDRFSVHPPVLGETFDPRFFREILRRLENALLDQMRLDVVIHEQSLIAEEIYSASAPFFTVATSLCNVRLESMLSNCASVGTGHRPVATGSCSRFAACRTGAARWRVRSVS